MKRRSILNIESLEKLKEGGYIKDFFINPEKLERKKNKSKFSNIKVIVDGKRFDSKKEARRYVELLVMEKNGKIHDLRLQVPYVLVERNETERECIYKADFQYRNRKDELVVEDTKGFKTQLYVLKRKLMLEKFGIKIIEI
jgi:hypothetical protein